MERRRAWLIVLGCLLGLAAPVAADAQALTNTFLDSEIPFDVSRGLNVGVLDRPRPDYEAQGIRTGGFTVYPRLSVGSGYTSNVYGAKTDAVGDGFASVSPSVEVASNWSRNAFTLTAGADLLRYFKQSPKDQNGLSLASTGRLDLGDGTLTGSARIRRAYESQLSANFLTGESGAIPYTQTTGELRYVWQGARFRLEGFGDVNRFTYSIVTFRNGNRIDERPRNRTVARSSGRVEYATSPDTAVFVQGTYLTSAYDEQFALFGFPDRNSHQVRVLAGATFDLTQIMRGSVGVGYVRRVYDNATYGAIGGLSAEARVEYYPTQLTTVTLLARRLVEDAISIGSGGYFVTQAGARVDHELLRNLLLHLEGAYERDRFQNTTRRDRSYRINAGANYLVNHRVGFGLELSHADRLSQGQPAGLTFVETRAALSASYQL